MNIYKISCVSKCGSYFESYLQSITVIATSETNALEVVKKWLKKNDKSFLYPQEKWKITLMVEDVSVSKVIDYNENSDY